MVRFLHTADWQLGMRRHFLKEEALPRYRQARIDAIQAIGALAKEHECEFIVVAGDVFESNQVDRRTSSRALEALASIECPVYLLPGNHDPLDAASLYRAPAFSPYVLKTNEPVVVRAGVEVVGAPWMSKRPGRDLWAQTCDALAPAAGVIRIGVAHGAVDERRPDIDLAKAQQALADGRVHYLALGDRHSVTEVASRIWYAGTPEATDYTETEPGQVLIVDVDEQTCRVEQKTVGRWSFLRRAFELRGIEDIELLTEWLFGLPNKDCAILRLDLTGVLALGNHVRLEAALDEATDLFAAVESHNKITVRPDAFELAELGLNGFARTTAEALAERDDETARDALALLHRLTQ